MEVSAGTPSVSAFSSSTYFAVVGCFSRIYDTYHDTAVTIQNVEMKAIYCFIGLFFVFTSYTMNKKTHLHVLPMYKKYPGYDSLLFVANTTSSLHLPLVAWPPLFCQTTEEGPTCNPIPSAKVKNNLCIIFP